MAREAMPDIIVLIPGITGSVLKKDGKVVWGWSGKALGTTLLTGGDSMRRSLALADDPPDADDLGDGIVADAVIPDLHLIPNFWKIDGYTKVADAIKATFEVTEGKNFFPFPYDWRRDNRVAARKLRRQSHDWLRGWRAATGNDKAKLIIIGHSMGGIVARYFLEVLDGWKDSRALVTFGTPFRGSLNAVDSLANGVRKGPMGLIDLSELGRTLTAVFQLLPVYPCYDAGDGKLVRVGETTGIPNLDATKAAKALAFHREIEEAVKAHEQHETYRRERYRMYPVVGINQPTSQSAKRDGGKVALIPAYQGKDMMGDGTVPRVSATPIEYSSDGRDMFAATKHASLQNADTVLVHLQGLISSMYLDLGAFRKPPAKKTKVALQVEDLYLAAEPVTIRARPDGNGAPLRAVVQSTAGKQVATVPLRAAEGGWQVGEVAPLPADTYRVHVTGGADVEPATDAFAVAGLRAEDVA